MDVLRGASESLKRYAFEDHVYKRNKLVNGVSFLVCVVNRCPGKCKLRDGSPPFVSSPHNHEPDESLVSKLRLKSYLLERAGSELTKYRLLYLDGIARSV